MKKHRYGHIVAQVARTISTRRRIQKQINGSLLYAVIAE